MAQQVNDPVLSPQQLGCCCACLIPTWELPHARCGQKKKRAGNRWWELALEGLEGLLCPVLCPSQTVPSLAGPVPVPVSQSTSVPSCLEFLLDNGADPSLRDRQGYTAVHYAAAYGNRQNLELVHVGPCLGKGSRAGWDRQSVQLWVYGFAAPRGS